MYNITEAAEELFSVVVADAHEVQDGEYQLSPAGTAVLVKVFETIPLEARAEVFIELLEMLQAAGYEIDADILGESN